MIKHRLLRTGPAQRASGEIKNTLHSVVTDVRELTDRLDEVRAHREPQPEAGFSPASPPADQLPPGLSSKIEFPYGEAVATEKTASPPPPENGHQNGGMDFVASAAPPAPPVERDGGNNGGSEVGPPFAETKTRFNGPTAAAAVSGGNTPPQFTPPPLPDLNRQLEVFMVTMISNQETIYRGLQKVTDICRVQERKYEALIREVDQLKSRLNCHARGF